MWDKVNKSFIGISNGAARARHININMDDIVTNAALSAASPIQSMPAACLNNLSGSAIKCQQSFPNLGLRRSPRSPGNSHIPPACYTRHTRLRSGHRASAAAASSAPCSCTTCWRRHNTLEATAWERVSFAEGHEVSIYLTPSAAAAAEATFWYSREATGRKPSSKPSAWLADGQMGAHPLKPVQWCLSDWDPAFSY